MVSAAEIFPSEHLIPDSVPFRPPSWVTPPAHGFGATTGQHHQQSQMSAQNPFTNPDLLFNFSACYRQMARCDTKLNSALRWERGAAPKPPTGKLRSLLPRAPHPPH